MTLKSQPTVKTKAIANACLQVVTESEQTKARAAEKCIEKQ